MNQLIDKILTEWAYRVDDGMPNPANEVHMIHLEESLNELNLPKPVVKKVLEKVRTYVDNTAGTITYSSGSVAINALTIASIENIRGAASTVIELTVTPDSNDVVPVRAQVIDIDVANSSFTVQADTLVGGSANAGIGYTTTSSY